MIALANRDSFETKGRTQGFSLRGGLSGSAIHFKTGFFRTETVWNTWKNQGIQKLRTISEIENFLVKPRKSQGFCKLK